jgi:hypothetical protein
VFEVIVPVAVRLLVWIEPDTVKFDKLLKEVMLFSAVSLNAPLKVPADTVPVAVRLFVLIEPLTVSAFTLPSCVMVFCAVWLKVPLNVPPSIVPDTDRFCS